jgi:hypothetical protein
MPPTNPTSSVTTELLTRALGEAVTRIWSNLPQDVQNHLFQEAVTSQGESIRSQLAVFLHDKHSRTADPLGKPREICLNHFTVREAVRDLRIDDRVLYMAIVARLSTFVTINKRPSEHLNRAARLQNQYDALKNLRTYLSKFDSDLAAVFAKDAQIAQ